MPDLTLQVKDKLSGVAFEVEIPADYSAGQLATAGHSPRLAHATLASAPACRGVERAPPTLIQTGP